LPADVLATTALARVDWANRRQCRAMNAIDIILATVIGLCVLLLVWPFTVYPLILCLVASRPLAPDPAAPVPSASLLFCAYNEAVALPAKIANLRLLKARHPDLEILAYDDGSSDGTCAMLAQAGDLLTLVRGPGRTGKAHGMKLLSARARGDVLIFTDANVLLDETAIDRLLAPYADAQVGGVLGSLVYGGAKASASAGVGALYWRLEEQLKDFESLTGNVIGADGSIFSIRRSLYPDFPDHVLDDLAVSMAVVFAGRRLVKARDAIARETMAAERGDEYRRKVRIAARAWHTHCHLRPQLRAMSRLDRFKYGSRKIARWFGALWIGIGGVAVLLFAWRLSPFAALVLTGAVLLLLLTGLRARSGPVAALIDLVLAYIATMRGVLLAMRGKTFTTWAPAKSRDGSI
jgi:cellulose synthase/poly-beta-1,6-N-acetylglucosamine synthase-like glycosyltransferase